MANGIPKIILRMGSHSEKEYIEKVAQFLDGLILGANVMEATPGATASLLLKLGGAQVGLRYLLDPMTYAYGCYIDPQSKVYRDDMDWIKSDQKGRNGKIIRTFKRSYRSLADQLGGIFSSALSSNSAIKPSTFSSAKVYQDTCRSVVDYQLERVSAEYKKDAEYAAFAAEIPKPNVVFAPYFYIDPKRADEWVEVMLELARTTIALQPGCPVHVVVCIDESFLSNQQFFDYLTAELPKTHVHGVWIWLSRLHEESAGKDKLRVYRTCIEHLSKHMQVFALHGGYFSLIMSKFGMSGVSHGVGYGEQKDVVPVIGQSTPTVRYYLKPIHRRLGVAQIERCFDALKITTVAEFHKQVCDCVVCRGVVAKRLSEFSSFGDTHFASLNSRRMAQTPAAAKRCRFHFLLNRVKERDWIGSANVSEIRAELREAHATWCKQPAVAADCDHLIDWENVLS
jgi:hypothetical protein